MSITKAMAIPALHMPILGMTVLRRTKRIAGDDSRIGSSETG